MQPCYYQADYSLERVVFLQDVTSTLSGWWLGPPQQSGFRHTTKFEKSRVRYVGAHKTKSPKKHFSKVLRISKTSTIPKILQMKATRNENQAVVYPWWVNNTGHSCLVTSHSGHNHVSCSVENNISLRSALRLNNHYPNKSGNPFCQAEIHLVSMEGWPEC